MTRRAEFHGAEGFKMNFRVGQKVVCVDDLAGSQYLLAAGLPPARNKNLHSLKTGQVYTIRNLAVVRGLAVCRVVEITRDIEPFFGVEGWYAQGRFRPVVERKTDISIFTALLNKQPEGITE